MAVAPFKVYGTPLITGVSRVLALLIEKDIPFQLIPFNMAEGQQKQPDYLKPLGYEQMPSFHDESISLHGASRAVCRYISDKYPNKGSKGLYGTNPLEKASIDQWLDIEGQGFHVLSSALIYATKIKLKQDEGLIKQSELLLSKLLDVYERKLGESQYLAGDDFTLADLSHLPNTQNLVSNTDRGELITSRKNVGRWWSEISSRESWKKVV